MVLERITCQILPDYQSSAKFCHTLTTSALATSCTYLFTPVLATPFPSP